jgi:hypothetical protein
MAYICLTLFPEQKLWRCKDISQRQKGALGMGNVSMAVLGGVTSAGLTLALGGHEGRGFVPVASAYFTGGLGAMALFVLARYMQDNT